MIDKKTRNIVAELIEKQIAPERKQLKGYIAELSAKVRRLEQKVKRLEADDNDRDDDEEEEMC